MTGAGEEGGFFDALGLGPVAAGDQRARAEQVSEEDHVSSAQEQKP